MAALHYSVIATLPDEATLQRYLDWLEGGHVQAVIAGGAHRATVARLQSDPPAVEVRYEFAHPADFERYEAEHAPALREEGRRLFGSIDGVAFQRRLASVRSVIDRRPEREH